MRYLITGSTGFIGRALVLELAKRRHEVYRLTRGPLDAADPRLFGWDPEKMELDLRAFEGVDAVIHLAGAGIADRRWTPSYKEKILQSRVKGTALLVHSITGLERRPQALLCGSAVGYYGSRGAEMLTEDSSRGEGFLADVCQAWEAEADRAAGLGLRVVKLRTASALDPSGGTLKKLLLPFRLGLGGRLGPGRQMFSWISLRDHLRAMLFLLERPDLSGPFNLSAPNPVSNAQFTAALARALNRPAVLPLPRAAARLMLGEMADELLFASQAVLPKRLKEAGFEFEEAYIGEALNKLLGGS